MNKHVGKFRQGDKERGAVAVMIAALLPVLLGMGALAIDIGHFMVVRSELQNAADAAALAGANDFYSGTSSGYSQTLSEPDFSVAEATAGSSISLNKSDGVTLADCDVKSGYWGSTSIPQVTVTVQRAAGENSGAVQTFLAGVVGIDTFDVSANATAICGPPGEVWPGTVLPVAIPKWVAETVSEGGKLVPSDDDEGDGDDDDGDDTVTIGSAYHYEHDPYSECVAGQWTSFTVDDNSDSYLNNLISCGNVGQLIVGDLIYIQPGTMADGYHSDTIGVYVGEDVVLPVVDAVLQQSIKDHVAVVGFVGFHVTELIKNEGIKGYFLTNVYVGGSAPGHGANYYGTYSSAKLIE